MTIALAAPVAIAGVDGCKAGWVAVTLLPGEKPHCSVFASFAAFLESLPENAAIAVDMPMGLPERTGPGGRGPEALVRRHLGARRSSVFSIPSRPAVYAETGPFEGQDAWYAAHRRANAVARATSDPPRGVSIQAFGIFGKIRELDGLMLARPALRTRIIESHPEAAFWRLNGEQAMATPKKIRGAVNPAGMEERKNLLARRGLADGFLAAQPPRGAGTDDFLDAAALLFVAARHTRGEAVPFPGPPQKDFYGIAITLWT